LRSSASRKIAFAFSDSTRALIISGGFAPGLLPQNGTSPQRMSSSTRALAFTITTGAGCVGATLKRAFHHSLCGAAGSIAASSSRAASPGLVTV
jgi:hypothetical protein